MIRARSWQLSVALAALVAAAPLSAQTPAPAPTPLDFSGVLFGSYNFQESPTGAPFNGQTDNAFVLDRAYLTFRMPAGDHMSIRVTTDVYQEAAGGSNNGWTIRAKYAYAQYAWPKMDNGAAVVARFGILHTVEIDHEEQFWPRYLSTTPIERAGFFSSADAGVASLITLPSKMGEAYLTITNGSGYTTRENNRFKDYAARLSLTPLANNADMPLLNTFTLTGWGYKGANASTFVNNVAPATNGPVGEALDRSRYGLFVGLKDPKLVLGFDYDITKTGGEQGANTAASPRTVTDLDGTLLAAFTVIHPLAFMDASGKSPFGIVARYDIVKPSSSTTGFVAPAAPSTDNQYHVAILGLLYDLNNKAQLALDYQEQTASNNGVSANPAPAKGYYLHFNVNF